MALHSPTSINRRLLAASKVESLSLSNPSFRTLLTWASEYLQVHTPHSVQRSSEVKIASVNHLTQPSTGNHLLIRYDQWRHLCEIISYPRFYIQKRKAFSYKTMVVDGATPHIQSIVQRINQDGRTTSPSPSQSPRRGTTPTSVHVETPLQDRPLFGPQRPEEMVDSTMDSQINRLLLIVKHQITLAEEQSRRIAELEKSKRQLI